MVPSLEFECGKVVQSVGSVGLACRAHIEQCDNADCQTEVINEATKAGLL